MAKASFSSPVNAPIEVLWDLLVDKIENPQRYVPGVSDVKILEKDGKSVLRQMTTPEITVKERITYDEDSREVVFTLVEHPQFSGEVLNKIIVPPDNKPSDPVILEFILDWQPLNPQAPRDEPDMSETIREAVLHTKQLAEEKAKG